MKTFILKARKGCTQATRLRDHIGQKGHVEIIAHTVINAFFVSQDFREDVEVCIVLDSSDDFPKTIQLIAQEGLSLDGFHEEAVYTLIENTLKKGALIQKNETQTLFPGVKLHGFGLETLLKQQYPNRSLYLLDPKGTPALAAPLVDDPVFILTDHISMPKNIVKSFKRRGVCMLSLGKKMLFASQCVILLHHVIDNLQNKP